MCFVHVRSIRMSFLQPFDMRRLSTEFALETAGGVYPGLLMQPSTSGETTPVEPDMAESLVKKVTCITCSNPVEVTAAISCLSCDAGPYHPGCEHEHKCPKDPPARVEGEDDLERALGSAMDDCRFDKAPPGDTGRDTDASWQLINPEMEEDSEGSSGGDEPPPKLP